MKEQWEKLSAKVSGHYAYYGITGNNASIGMFAERVKYIWQKWLNRRNRERSLNWKAFERLAKQYPLPNPKIVHSIFKRKGDQHERQNEVLRNRMQ